MNYARSFTSYPSLIRVPADINPELIVEAHPNCALLPQGRTQASSVPSSHLDIIHYCVSNAYAKNIGSLSLLLVLVQIKDTLK